MRLTHEQQAEIDSQRQAAAPTRRATVPALEDMLYGALPVLDHGFVRVIDYMGDDAAVVQAARVSYGRGTRRVSEDAGLIRYLMRHRHSTPFEMCEIKYHVKLPIFVAPASSTASSICPRPSTWRRRAAATARAAAPCWRERKPPPCSTCSGTTPR